jgi:hypothetical protein
MTDGIFCVMFQTVLDIELFLAPSNNKSLSGSQQEYSSNQISDNKELARKDFIGWKIGILDVLIDMSMT